MICAFGVFSYFFFFSTFAFVICCFLLMMSTVCCPLANTAENVDCDQGWAYQNMTPKSALFHVGIWAPRLIDDSLSPPEFTSKRHLDRFNRCVGLTYTGGWFSDFLAAFSRLKRLSSTNFWEWQCYHGITDRK